MRKKAQISSVRRWACLICYRNTFGIKSFKCWTWTARFSEVQLNFPSEANCKSLMRVFLWPFGVAPPTIAVEFPSLSSGIRKALSSAVFLNKTQRDASLCDTAVGEKTRYKSTWQNSVKIKSKREMLFIYFT